MEEEQPSLEDLASATARYAKEPGDGEAAYTALGSLVDAAGDARDQQHLLLALNLAEKIQAGCQPKFACLVNYARANAWSALRNARTTEANAWNWDQPELLQEIFWLRATIQHAGFPALEGPLRARALCNLGNALSSAGRFVDAVAEWRRALDEQPELGMASGNLGDGLTTYAYFVYDPGHTIVFLQHSRKQLERAIAGGVGRDGATYPEALAHFRTKRDQVVRWLRANGADDEHELKSYSLGKTKREQAYRKWALKRRLFINPLNDLASESVAAQDVLMLPPHRVQGAGITLLAFYNQLKQEYAYARWCLFEGTTWGGLHVADKNVALAFNADYALYSIALEQVKTAYRCAYSLFDKIAYFVNDYWKLGIPERGVSFRTVWLEQAKGKDSQRRLREPLEARENLPLRGLYWLSKDIFDTDLAEVAEPNAREFDVLRNHLEHKLAKVVDRLALIGTPSEPFVDRLSHLVVREDLEDRTERLLQLARSALIYLSLAVHVEEGRASKSDSLTMPLALGTYPDSLKR